MDYKELIEQLRKLLPQKVDYAEMVGAEAVHYGKSFVYEDPESYIIEAAANAIEALLVERDAALLRAQQTTLGGTYVSIEWFKAVQAELDALKAKQTAKLDRIRWEGCEYCAHQKDNVELCPMLSHDESDCDRGMYIHDGCLISNSGEFQYTEIKFCPKCGRPLTEEAWAEMERRINGGTTD